jgi:hypothetical protein
MADPLPVLKVLYRDTSCMQGSKEVLQPVAPD